MLGWILCRFHGSNKQRKKSLYVGLNLTGAGGEGGGLKEIPLCWVESVTGHWYMLGAERNPFMLGWILPIQQNEAKIFKKSLYVGLNLGATTLLAIINAGIPISWVESWESYVKGNNPVWNPFSLGWRKKKVFISIFFFCVNI